MPALKSFIWGLFGRTARLSDLERRILNCVNGHLDGPVSELWNKQIQAINKIQRLPEGVEVNFYRMKAGRPTFDAQLAFQNRAEELQIAKLQIRLVNVSRRLFARVWCVKGFLFSIEYEGSVSYFEEAAGLEGESELQIDCELIADLAHPG